MADAATTETKTSFSAGGGGVFVRIDAWLGRVFGFGNSARVSLYRRLSKFANRGVPVPQALDGMWQRLEARKDSRRHCYRDLIRKLYEGASVAKVFSGYVPETERVLIAAGERSGTLASGFEMAATVADGAKQMRSLVRSKLSEPLILVIALVAVLVVMTIFVLPPLVTLSPDTAHWPWTARLLYLIATATRAVGIYILLFGITLGIVVVRSLPRWTGKTRGWFDRHIPPYTLYRAYQNATFLLALGELTRNGTPITEAIQLMDGVAMPWMRSHLNKMMVRMHEGFEPGRAIDTGMLDQTTMDDVEDYMRAGTFSDAISAIGQDAVDDGIKRVAKAAGVVFGISLFSVGFVMFLMSVGPMMLTMQKFDAMQPGHVSKMR